MSKKEKQCFTLSIGLNICIQHMWCGCYLGCTIILQITYLSKMFSTRHKLPATLYNCSSYSDVQIQYKTWKCCYLAVKFFLS